MSGDLKKDPRRFAAVNVRMNQRLGQLEGTAQASLAHGKAACGDCGGLRGAAVMAPYPPVIVVTVKRHLSRAQAVRQVPPQLQARIGSAVAGDLGYLEPAPQYLTADFELLRVGQRVARILGEGIEPHRPALVDEKDSR